MDEFLLADGNGDNINPSTRPVRIFFPRRRKLRATSPGNNF
jgi:hypothetical protein